MEGGRCQSHAAEVVLRATCVVWCAPGYTHCSQHCCCCLSPFNSAASPAAAAGAAKVRELLSRRDLPADDAAFISIDGRGADVRVRTGGEYNVERIGFDEVCEGFSRVLAGGCGAGSQSTGFLAGSCCFWARRWCCFVFC